MIQLLFFEYIKNCWLFFIFPINVCELICQAIYGGSSQLNSRLFMCSQLESVHYYDESQLRIKIVEINSRPDCQLCM